jgi:hypothetical protein
MKICTKCKIEKPLSEFSSRADRLGKYRSQCKDCRKKYTIAYNQKYWIDNKEDLSFKNKTYRENNLDKCKATCREYQTKNKKELLEKHLTYLGNRKKLDESFRLKCNIKRRILIALQNQSCSKKDSTFKMTGLSGKELYNYFLSKNYNSTIHHIDHIVPLSRFDLKKENHQMVAFYYLNMQPLTPAENFKKNDFLLDGWQDKIIEICIARDIKPEPIIQHIQAGI